MTGLESHLETEIAKQAHQPDEALLHAQELREAESPLEPARETEEDRKVEGAMHLAG
jgi:hypothetical protein